MQCQKSLYLYKNYFNDRDIPSKEQQAKFKRGHDIGTLAHQLFPGGKDMSPKSPRQFNQSLPVTRYYIEQKTPVLYEASFRYQGIIIFLDILVYKDDKWYGYEVKSAKRVTETHINDAAIQYHVIKNSGLQLADLSIIYVNPAYQYDEIDYNELNINDLFLEKSVLSTVIERQTAIEDAIYKARLTLQEDNIPNISIGDHCNSPYSCDFKGFCGYSD